MKVRATSIRWWAGWSVLAVLLCGPAVNAAADTTILSESFDSGLPAGGWQAIMSTGDVGWQVTVDEAANWTSTTAGRHLAAVADSQWTYGAYDASLVTPQIHLPPAKGLELSFLTLFETWTGAESADVDVYSVSGDTWTTVAHYDNDNLVEGILEGPVAISLADYEGGDIRLRFRYHNDRTGLPPGTSFFGDLYWQVDEVRVMAGDLWGDADSSGSVGISDFVILKNNFGMTGATWSEADFDGNGTVGIPDFVILKNNFGNTAAVPEPMTLSLLGLGGLLLPPRRVKD